MASGEVVGPPDSIGIGAPRAGSSWVAKLLAAHPLVHRQPWGKELHFFDRYYDRPFEQADVDEYHAHFPRPAGMQTFDFTPGYLYQPWARGQVARAAPDALILVVLRDPLAQFESSINYSAYLGAPNNGIMVSRHLGEAMYDVHLARWRDLPRERLAIVQLERCRDEPDVVVRDLWARMGLDPTAEVATRKGRNEARETTIELPDATRRSVVELLEPDVARLAAAHPEIDLARWPAFAHLA